MTTTKTTTTTTATTTKTNTEEKGETKDDETERRDTEQEEQEQEEQEQEEQEGSRRLTTRRETDTFDDERPLETTQPYENSSSTRGITTDSTATTSPLQDGTTNPTIEINTDDHDDDTYMPAAYPYSTLTFWTLTPTKVVDNLKVSRDGCSAGEQTASSESNRESTGILDDEGDFNDNGVPTDFLGCEPDNGEYSHWESDIPREIWVHIFGYLPLSDLMSTMCTCRRMKSLVEDESLWRSLSLRHPLANATLDKPKVVLWKDWYECALSVQRIAEGCTIS